MLTSLPSVIQAYIRAYNDRDTGAMLACLAPDIAFSNISGNQVTASAAGKTEFGKMAEAALGYFAARKQTVVNAITVADTTLIEVDYHATMAMDLPNGWKKGEEISLKGRSLFDLKDGQILRLVDQT